MPPPTILKTENTLPPVSFNTFDLQQNRYSNMEPIIIGEVSQVLSQTQYRLPSVREKAIYDITTQKISQIKVAAIIKMKKQQTLEDIEYIADEAKENVRLYLTHSGFAIQYITLCQGQKITHKYAQKKVGGDLSRISMCLRENR